jgi:hypothetical protein
MAKLMLRNVRLSFPTLWEPKGFEGGKPAYSVTCIVEKDHPDLAEWQQAIDAVGKDKFKAKWADVKELLTKQDKLPIHDGMNKAHLDGYEGNLYIAARTYNRPVVVDTDRTPLTERDGKPYAGCYANVSVEFWAQDGDAFGGGTAMNDEEFDLLDVANFV